MVLENILNKNHMGKVDGLTQDESLRGYLNELIENDENQAELYWLRQQLDELLVSIIRRYVNSSRQELNAKIRVLACIITCDKIVKINIMSNERIVGLFRTRPRQQG